MAASSCPASANGYAEKHRQLEEILKEYKGVPGGLIPVLHQTQLLFGYLPHDVLVRIAEELDLPLSEIYGVCSFYSFFSLKPRGKYTVNVCMGTACYVKGAPALLEKIKETLQIEDGKQKTVFSPLTPPDVWGPAGWRRCLPLAMTFTAG